MGVNLPSDCVKVGIVGKAPDDTLLIVFHMQSIGDDVIRKSEVKVLKSDGTPMIVKEFFKGVKDAAQLPDETTGFTITASMNEIVSITTDSAFPMDSLGFLIDCKFEYN